MEPTKGIKLEVYTRGVKPGTGRERRREGGGRKGREADKHTHRRRALLEVKGMNREKRGKQVKRESETLERRETFARAVTAMTVPEQCHCLDSRRGIKREGMAKR